MILVANNRELLENQRAEYGKQIASAVSTQLQAEYGKKSFEPCSIWRMMQFAKMFPDFQIVSPLVSILYNTGTSCDVTTEPSLLCCTTQFNY